METLTACQSCRAVGQEELTFQAPALASKVFISSSNI